jgi:hypothetical protein
MRVSRRAVAASRWADISAISSPRRSSSWMFGGEGTKDGRAVADTAADDTLLHIEWTSFTAENASATSFCSLYGTLHRGFRTAGMRP